MWILKTPKPLKDMSFLLGLAVLLVPLQWFLLLKAQGFALPFKEWFLSPNLGVTVCVGVVLLLMLRHRLLRADPLAWPLLAALSGAWFVGNLLMAIFYRSPLLAFFGLLLIALLGPVLFLIRRELRRPYWNSGLPWYQGRTRLIPDFRAEFTPASDGTVAPELGPLGVGRLDFYGIYLMEDPKVGPARPLTKLWESWQNGKKVGAPVGAVLLFRGYSVECDLKPVGIEQLEASGGPVMGMGFEFVFPSSDKMKQMADFIERLKGEGYVEA